MRAELKRLHSPDVTGPLERFKPGDDGNFGFLVQVMAGPEGEESEESFDVIVCSPAWLERRLQREPLIGRHHLFMRKYDYETLTAFIASHCQRCTGDTWAQVADRLGRLGRWEFEDYTPKRS